MSVVQHYDRYKRFNPSSIAESIAKSRAGVEGSLHQTSDQGQVHDNRAARPEATGAAVVEEAGQGGEKRKADAGSEDVDMDGDNSRISKMQKIG